MSHLKNRDSNAPRRKQRQAEAQVRQELAAKRSPQEQLARLDKGLNNPYFPGVRLNARKERAKLAAKLETPPVVLPGPEKGADAKPAAQAATQTPKKAPRASKKP